MSFHFRKAFITLHLTKSGGQIDVREDLRRLVKKLQAMSTDLEISQLFGSYDLDNHRRLMR